MVKQEFNKKEVKSYSALSAFPNPGSSDTIYIDTTSNTPYYFDTVSGTYKPLSASATAGVSVYVQASSSTKPSPAVEGDELIVTDNGLVSGTVTEQWIYEGGAWIQRPNDKVLDVLTTPQTAPTIGSGNTTNLGKIFKDASGNSYIVDYSGEAIQLSSPIFKELNQFHVDKNGNDTTGTGADEAPFLTITKALSVAPQADAVVVTEGTYAEAVTISTQNLTLRGEGNEYGGLTEINSLAVTATGTSVRVSSLTVLNNTTHTGTSPLYLADVTLNGNYTSSTTAYAEIKESRVQTGTISKTAAGILHITDSLIGNATFSTANSVISLRNVTIDAGKKVIIGAGVIYNVQDCVGEVEINAAAIPVETVLLAQGLTAEQAKATQTSSFNMLRMLDPDTNNSNTNVVSWNTTTKRLEVSNIPTGGGSWNTGTVTPSLTGNTTTSLGVTSLPAFYENTTTGVRYYIDANGVSKAIEGRVTTSLLGRNGNGTAYVNPTMTSGTTTVDVLELSDGTFAHVGQIKYPGHGLVKHAYYFGSATAPYFTVIPPTSGILQQVFYVIDENTIDIDIEQGVTIDLANYANVVYVNNTNVNNGTIYDTNNPPTTNNNALKGDVANLYIGSDGSLWVWNGTDYVTKPATNNTEWYLGATQVDAGGNKTSSISRSGWVFVGANKNATCPLDLENNAPGTAFMNVARYIATNQNVAGRTTMFTMGANQSAGNIADWRFYYAGPASGNNRSEFGFSGNVSPNLAMLYNGLNGIGTTAPVSNLDVNGSFGFNIRGAGSSTTQTDSDGTVVFTVIGAVYTLLAPTANNNRRVISVKNQTTGTISVVGHIDGVAGTTLTIPAKGSRILQSNGTSWWIIAGYL